MSRMNDLMYDLETLSDYYTFQDKTEAYNRLKQHIQQTEEFMSKLREIDLEELNKLGKRYFWIWQGSDNSTHRLYLKEEPEFQSLLNLIKEVK